MDDKSDNSARGRLDALPLRPWTMLALVLVALAGCEREDWPAPTGNTYGAGGLPDRVILTPGADPSREMAVAFRTDARQPAARVQLAPALDGPSLEMHARTLKGTTRAIQTENGLAHYHQVKLGDLSVGHRYAYRVQGANGWSEWFQFSTAAAAFEPFRFVYFGDTQNDIRSLGSRVIRQGLSAAGPPALVLHAGDLVNQRDDFNDSEWGEWTGTGGYQFASIPQLPVAGNHEYIDVVLADGEERRVLSPHWPLQFALPDNGAPPVQATTYFIDYQDVRFVVLDGTSALELGSLRAQTDWLHEVLASNTARWTIVSMHQPVYPCARSEDNGELEHAWTPLFRARHVDLVLQGHDHCYGRVSRPHGKTEAGASDVLDGPIYVVSVAGPKMYGLNARIRERADRVAEETQLYQVIEIEETRLRFQAFTASGSLYDAFDLQRDADGRNRLIEMPAKRLPPRTCSGARGPDATPCVAEPR